MRSIITLTAIFVLCVVGCAQDVRITVDQLPEKALAYIKTHFSEQKIIISEKEVDFLERSYEVYLDNHVELEFDSRGDVEKISSHIKLPNSVIPPKILSYVETHYPNNFIVEWKGKSSKQEVELDNELELEFKKDGDFVRIDY